MFESFGYKHGIPGDADFVFDVRSLPNPYWSTRCARSTGRDRAVVEYLAGQDSVRAMIAALAEFLDAAHRGVRSGEPQLPDHRGRLHRRPASLRVHRRAAGRALPQRLPAGAHPARLAAEGMTSSQREELADFLGPRAGVADARARSARGYSRARTTDSSAIAFPRCCWRPCCAAARASCAAAPRGAGGRFRSDPATERAPDNRCARTLGSSLWLLMRSRSECSWSMNSESSMKPNICPKVGSAADCASRVPARRGVAHADHQQAVGAQVDGRAQGRGLAHGSVAVILLMQAEWGGTGTASTGSPSDAPASAAPARPCATPWSRARSAKSTHKR